MKALLLYGMSPILLHKELVPLYIMSIILLILWIKQIIEHMLDWSKNWEFHYSKWTQSPCPQFYPSKSWSHCKITHH